MTQPKSKAYRFDRLMAENDMCQSWWATRIATGQKCFIKTISQTNMLNVSALKEILSDSFACQKGAYSFKVLWARRKRLEAGNLFVEYPYLDTEVWQELTPENSLADFNSILLQICIVIDYLHLLDLVHCDLKLSNFLVNSSNGSRSVILVDLDFLCKTDSRPKAKILGTPEHIAPEIRANDRITTQSDNYSLGVSLAKLVEHFESRAQSTGESAAVDIEKLKAFTAQLTQEDPIRRPRSLVEGLRQYELIDESTYKSAQKSVLAMGLLTAFRRERRKLANAGGGLKSFFQRNRMLGLREELVIDFNAAYSNRPLETLKTFKFLFQNAEISRLGDYWHFSADDDTLQKTYGRLERIIASGPGPAPLVSVPERVDIDRLVAEAEEDEKSEHFQKAFLRLKTALKALGDDPDGGESDKRERIHRKLAYLATVLNRVSLAVEYYEKVREVLDRDNRFDPELLYELILCYNSMADYEQGTRLAERALADQRLKENPRYYLQMKRSLAFDAGLRGRLEEATAAIEETLAEAKEVGDHQVETMATYTQAIIAFWQGDKPAAVKHLQNALRGARTTDSPFSVMLITNLLAMIHHERAEFRKAIEYAKMSEENAVSPLAALRLPAVFYTLSAAHMREGEYRKAEYWLQRVFNLKSVDVDRSALVSHYCYDAFLKANSGHLENARSSCVQALQLLRSAPSSAYQGKAYHNLAEIALYRGKMDECTSALNSAAAVFEEIGDKSSLAEIATIRAIQDVYYSRGPVDASPLNKHIEELLKYDCRMYAALTVLYVLLSSDSAASKGAIKLIEPFLDPHAKTSSPVLRSLINLVKLVRSGDNSPNAHIRTLKEIHSILVEGEQKFLGMLSAYRIGQLYLLESRVKFARKFFLRARTLAESLSNDSFQAKINDELKLTLAGAEGESQLVHSIHVISEIFQNIDRYADSLKAMVRFAVEATGAERGALLLKKEQSGKLQVVAYENC
ncbi:MAG: protein kinase, partial [Candidatus Zixiibacteriota bacterium]